MVDIFALSIPHFLLVIAAFRMVTRPALDIEGLAVSKFGLRKKRAVVVPSEDGATDDIAP